MSKVPVSILDDQLPTISFLGHSGCGKDTACIWLADNVPGYTFEGSSSHYLIPIAAEHLGIPEAVLRADRHKYAMDLFNTGNKLRGDNPGYLLQKVLERQNLVAGLRDRCEIEYGRSHNLVDLFVWIESNRVKVDPTVAFGPEDCDIVILNNSSLQDFYDKLGRLAKIVVG